MLGENIKALRKRKGFTQEELAVRVNVVRQTVSKWEKGLSVPDADSLQKIADVLETNISQLLGADIQSEKNNNEVAEQLSRINEQLVIKNRRARRIWTTIAVILLAVVIFYIVVLLFAIPAYKAYKVTPDEVIVEEITTDIEERD